MIILAVLCVIITKSLCNDVYKFEIPNQMGMSLRSSGIACQDGVTKCDDSSTCCKIGNKGYGCCPIANAECCADGVHCCPGGTTCNVATSNCDAKNGWTVALLKKTTLRKVEAKKCPDGQTQCGDTETCCQLGDGSYGCCPDKNAVCCADHIHCCPQGTTCNLSAGTCDSGSRATVPLLKKSPSKKLEDVVCPDGKSTCSDGQTCCVQAGSSYGCCPSPNAVCCSDQIHCCPSGTKCNIAAGTCDTGKRDAIPMLKKSPPKKLENVVCPDGESICADGQTCCLLSDGSYGCCPYPNAVCCSDHIHCCPQGTTCNLSAGTCDSGNRVTVPLLKKSPSKKMEAVICPHGQSICADGQTCCVQADGSYSCCPSPNAVCCSDHIHCCPSGTKCNIAAQTCDTGNRDVIPLLKKSPPKKLEDVVCPDGQSICADGQTCCLLSDGSYGCCPMPDAVCCSDHIHCCPQGTTCNPSARTCDSGNKESIQMLKKSPPKKLKAVICPDGKSTCSDGQTCCVQADGSYSCCPSPNAVCCSDHIHCCPSGTKCNIAAQTCDTGKRDAIPMLKKSPSKKLEDIVCPDGQSICPDDQTCCLLSNGSYGCCPMPGAVCCSDHIHCCPFGTICNVPRNTCDPGNGDMISFMKKIPSRKIEDKLCPDGSSRCGDEMTCCEKTDGSYACCGLPNATCCSGGRKCCPKGYKCKSNPPMCVQNIGEIFKK